MTNKLFYGDNLHVLRNYVADESVDLIYLDPPFNSKRDYNLLFKTPKGMESDAQITAFEDTWHWGEQAEREFRELMQHLNTDVAQMMRALRDFLGQNDLMAYLTMMANRLLELHRVLKPTGSLYLHCDPTASHYLKVVLDGVFGKENFRSEISWKRSSAHNDAKQGRKQYGNIRDVIFFYTKSDTWKWNWLYGEYSEAYLETNYKHIDPETGRYYRLDNLTAAKPGGDVSFEFMGTKPYKGRYWAYSRENMEKFYNDGRLYFPKNGGTPAYKRYLDEMPGVPLQNSWDDIQPAQGTEYLGYPTQKPLALLERIIKASSNAGDVVLDPFCGCGTAVHAAQKLKRRWIGIDITHLAVSLIEKRLKQSFPELAGAGSKSKAPSSQPFSRAETGSNPGSSNPGGSNHGGLNPGGPTWLDGSNARLSSGTDFPLPPGEGPRVRENEARSSAEGDHASEIADSPTEGFVVIGVPQDLEAARDLAERSKHEFQLWACTLVGAQPYKGGKRGADQGIDGLIFPLVSKGKSEKIVVSVKGGEFRGSSFIRDLKGVLEREQAAIGLYVGLAPPTREMVKEAASAGFYESPHHGAFPKIQLLTIEGLMNGSERARFPDMSQGGGTFKAAKLEEQATEQKPLF